MDFLKTKLNKDVLGVINDYLMVDKQTVKDNHIHVCKSMRSLHECSWCSAIFACHIYSDGEPFDNRSVDCGCKIYYYSRRSHFDLSLPGGGMKFCSRSCWAYIRDYCLSDIGELPDGLTSKEMRLYAKKYKIRYGPLHDVGLRWLGLGFFSY
jgi:hypothetical protein